MPYVTSPVLPAGTLSRIAAAPAPHRRRTAAAPLAGRGRARRPRGFPGPADAPVAHPAQRLRGGGRRLDRGVAGGVGGRADRAVGRHRRGRRPVAGAGGAARDRLGDGVAEVAYWTTAAARGQGTAARATTVLSRWALEGIGFHRLELMHATANRASCRCRRQGGLRPGGHQAQRPPPPGRLARHAPARAPTRRLTEAPRPPVTVRLRYGTLPAAVRFRHAR